MKDEQARAIRALLERQRIASLGTLHAGEPFVSMVPFVVLAEGPDFVIHVSALAAHTKDMLADPRVSLLINAPEDPQVPPQATLRLTVQGDAAQPGKTGDRYEHAKRAYLARFPDSEAMFGLGDFSIFTIRPRLLRFVGGFAQAKSLSAETLSTILR